MVIKTLPTKFQKRYLDVMKKKIEKKWSMENFLTVLLTIQVSKIYLKVFSKTEKISVSRLRICILEVFDIGRYSGWKMIDQILSTIDPF